MNAIVPLPRQAVSVRVGTMADLLFVDALQKKHTKMVGWMPTATLEGKIKAGHAIIAESDAKERVGYCIGNDQYFKRDDVGIIYQMNVVPQRQRGLIGATLVKAMFDRAAYGCRLFCCWCAQDIEANYFWESLGFVPLAFRTGSERRSRVHIFWQRRISAGDETTPYWFPSQTGSGAIREDRLVFPIPPGMRWKDELPRVLPSDATPKLEDLEARRSRGSKPKLPKPPVAMIGRLQLTVPEAPKAAVEKAKKEPRPKRKNDPKLVAAARELRDQWMEQVNADASLLLPAGKYDVSRALAGPVGDVVVEMPALPAPMAA